MKLGIYSNFIYPHIGGSECVIESISKRLKKYCGYDIEQYGCNIYRKRFIDGFIRAPYTKETTVDSLINEINSFDIVWVYSDSFWGMRNIIENIGLIKPKIFITLIGSYFLEKNEDIVRIINENSNKFCLMCHDENTRKKSLMLGISVRIHKIANGVDISEFRKNTVDFRKKYGLGSKKILLNVANYFYGKGQEYLPIIGKKLLEYRNDFVIISISSSLSYPYEKNFISRVYKDVNLFSIPFKHMKDLSREDVVSAFLSSNLFVFTSRKEVSPIVILESQAASLPWISFNVGDIGMRKGGIPINIQKFDSKGMILPNNDEFDKFVQEVNLLLDGKYENVLSNDGVEELDWDNIYKLYDEVFRNG